MARGAWAWLGSDTPTAPWLILSVSDWSELVSSTTYFGGDQGNAW